jgi:hypothetical protein
MASAPDELSALCNFLLLPGAPFDPSYLVGAPVVAIAVCHVGAPEEAQRDLGRLRCLGDPLIDRIAPMPYTRLQRMYDAAGVFGRHTYGRSGHLTALSDEVIDILATHAARIDSPFSIVMVSALGGAVARVGEQDTAFGYRNTAFDVAIDSVWSDPEESVRHVHSTDELWRAVRPFTAGVYVNELGAEGEARVREAYHPQTYRRLARLKSAYDPENFFRLNQNIPPEA